MYRAVSKACPSQGGAICPTHTSLSQRCIRPAIIKPIEILKPAHAHQKVKNTYFSTPFQWTITAGDPNETKEDFIQSNFLSKQIHLFVQIYVG